MQRVGHDAGVHHVLCRDGHVIEDCHGVVVGVVAQIDGDLRPFLNGGPVQRLVPLGDHGVPTVRPDRRAEGRLELRGGGLGPPTGGRPAAHRRVHGCTHAAQHVLCQPRLDIGGCLQRHRDRRGALRIATRRPGRIDAHVLGHAGDVARTAAYGQLRIEDHPVDVVLRETGVLDRQVCGFSQQAHGVSARARPLRLQLPYPDYGSRAAQIVIHRIDPRSFHRPRRTRRNEIEPYGSESSVSPASNLG